MTGINRSGSVICDLFEYQNKDYHSNKLLQVIHSTWKNQEFCDINLIIGKQEQIVSAHRIILASFCGYFNRLLKPNMVEGTQTSIRCFEHLHAPAVIKLIEFGYSGAINLNPAEEEIGIEQLLEAADYIGLEDVCNHIALFLETNLNEENCLGFLQCADHYNLITLKKKAFNYASQYYYPVSKVEEFQSLPPHFLEQLLKSERLVVVKHGIVIPLEQQEQFVVESVLKYVSFNLEERHSLLPLLLRLTKLPLLSHVQIKTLGEETIVKASKGCIEVIEEAKQCISLSTSDQTEGYSWRIPRKCQGLVLREQCEYAGGGQVQPEVSMFGCKEILEKNINTFIEQIKLGFRRWDGRLVLGGIQVFYNTGPHCTAGMDPTSCEETKYIKLEPHERIVRANVNSGFMIDQITFFTNLGKTFGPYGGDGGSSHSEKPPENCCGYLAGIACAVVKSQGSDGITKLRLTWGYYDFSDDQEAVSKPVKVSIYNRDNTFDWHHEESDGSYYESEHDHSEDEGSENMSNEDGAPFEF